MLVEKARDESGRLDCSQKRARARYQEGYHLNRSSCNTQTCIHGLGPKSIVARAFVFPFEIWVRGEVVFFHDFGNKYEPANKILTSSSAWEGRHTWPHKLRFLYLLD